MGEGSGDLLSVSLELADKCHNKIQTPLAVAVLNLAVKTAGANDTPEWKTERKKEGRKRMKEKKNKGRQE